MNDRLRPFRVLRLGLHLFDLVGFWWPWLKAAVWYWRLPKV